MLVVRAPKGTNKKKSRGASIDPSASAIVYRGPVKAPREAMSEDMATIQLNYYGSIATTAGGVINSVLDAYSQLTSSADWSSLQNLYQEYRILSMNVVFVPWNKYNMPTTSSLAPIMSVTDRTSSTALSSLANACSYTSVKVHSPSSTFSRTIKMSGTDEATWVLTGSAPTASARLYVKLS